MWLDPKQWRAEKLLSLAEDLMIQKFVIASHSKQVVNDTGRGTNGNCGCIISEVKQ